ncbi:DUF2934 domain-containing protein [Salipiger abyssi]|uniref:DUF2934 domain-containing protein n=1 Tax=Salipiger abyssi TaxID=1250539 RepID=UPI004059E560
MSTAAPTEAQIAEAAYFLWLNEGCPEGKQALHWAEASASLSDAAPKPKRKPTAKKAVAKAKAATEKPKTKAKTAEKKASKPRKAKAKSAG